MSRPQKLPRTTVVARRSRQQFPNTVRPGADCRKACARAMFTVGCKPSVDAAAPLRPPPRRPPQISSMPSRRRSSSAARTWRRSPASLGMPNRCVPRTSRRAREEAAQHPHPRRHGFTGPGAGRVRDRARAQGHADQSQQDAPRLLQGPRRAADRRPERRHERAQGPQVRRRDRQPDDAAGVGAERRAVPEGQHRATTSSSRRSPSTPTTRTRGPTRAIRRIADARRSRSVHAGSDRRAAGTTARSRRSPSAKSRSTIRESTRSSGPGLIVGPLDRDRSLHLLAVAHRQGRRSARAGRRQRSGAVHRLARPRRVDDSHGGEPRRSACSTRPGPSSRTTMAEMLYGIKAATHERGARSPGCRPAFLAGAEGPRVGDVGAGADAGMPVWVPDRPTTSAFSRRTIDKALAAGLTFRRSPSRRRRRSTGTRRVPRRSCEALSQGKLAGISAQRRQKCSPRGRRSRGRRSERQASRAGGLTARRRAPAARRRRARRRSARDAHVVRVLLLPAEQLLRAASDARRGRRGVGHRAISRGCSRRRSR